MSETVTPFRPKPRLRALARDARGTAAIEFAIILPVAALLYIGIVDVSRGVIASRKLDYLARTISDLVSQRPSNEPVPIADLSAILTASSAIMQPFDTSRLTMTVSAVDVALKKNSTTCCDALVRWTYTQGGTLRQCNTPLSQVANGTKPAPTNLPASVITANQSAGFNYAGGQTSYIIITDVTYTYRPIFSQALAWFSPGMSKTMYMVPRYSSGPVVIADPSTAPSGQGGRICLS